MRYKYNVNSGIKRIITKSEKSLYGITLAIAGLGVAVALPFAAKAAEPSTVVVTPSNTQGWTTADTRPGGAVNYVSDPTAPGNPHYGALQLTTDATTASKAQYLHDANTPLSNVTELSYSTKQNSASFPGGDASYQLPVCLGGVVAPTPTNPTGCLGLWSSRTVTDGTCAVVAGGGGAHFYNLATLKTTCPNAVVVGFGVNIGANNPSYNVEADLVNFNGTTYNFEPFATASDKDACKNGGYKNLTDQNGVAFKNQGQCVSWTNGRGQ
jgi:hypothetical protein